MRQPSVLPGKGISGLLACALLLGALPAPAALTDLSTSPLQSAGPVVKPNVLFILDDSGSMNWDFMPDWAYTSTASLARNSGFNATYYDPALRYKPPVRPDGSFYPTMNAASTSNWTAVPFDGFGVQTARSTGNDNLFTNENSGTTQNLVGQAVYYVFVPGEYCTDLDLKNCVTTTAETTTHKFPALLRWCKPNNLSDCRASRIDATQRAYTSVRYPGMAQGLFQPNVPGQNLRTNIVSTDNSYPYPGKSDKAEDRDDCAGSTCTYAEEMTNFANWWAYYRTRMQMAKSAASLAFKDIDSRFRIGYMSINNNTGSDFLNVLDVDSSPTGQKYRWYGKLLAAKPGDSTPLRTALSNAGRYFANTSGSVNGVTASDPMQYACQRNFTLLSTDGYWNDRIEPRGVETDIYIRDHDGTAALPYRDGNSTPNTLADIAHYFFTTDIRDRAYGNSTNSALNRDVSSNDVVNVPDGRQTMRTSTIGLGASGYMQYRDDYMSAVSGDYAAIAQGKKASNEVCEWQASGTTCTWPSPVSGGQTTIDDLWHAAVNGRGTYYSAASPKQLQAGLEKFMGEAERLAAVQVTPPAVSSLNLTEDDRQSFDTKFSPGDWFGDVVGYLRNASTGNAGNTVQWSQSEAKDAENGKTVPQLDSRLAADRNIFTYEPNASRSDGTIAFKWADMASETRRHFRTTAIGALSQMCASGSGCLPTGVRFDSDTPGPGSGVGGVNLVNFLRGDRSLEGAATGKFYRQRTHVLGDVVDARPVYVKKALFGYGDAGYDDFRTKVKDRQGMLYVAANDGMLHAFQASDGVEAWAYVPSLVLPTMFKLADRDYANRHTFYLNATPHHGDIHNGSAWRTILVGGLGQGGRGYYALDITDAAARPKVLWEFTHDRSKGTGYVVDEDMGYSYGRPVIAKISDGTWVVIVASGYNNVSPGTGRGFIWVLDAWTGRVIRKIDTGAGSLTETQPGCTGAPCPAGLAHLRGYGTNTDRNNLSLRVYGGDLLGNVWRFDVSKLTKAGGEAPVTKLATLTAPNGTRQPVTSPPSLGTMSGFSTVFLGTGSYLGLSDLGTTGKQSYYAIKDTLATAAANSSVHGNPRDRTCTAASANCFMKRTITEASNGNRNIADTAGYAMDFKTMGGWYVDLPQPGERVVASSDLLPGLLVFASGVPSSNAACSSDGRSYLNYVDPSSGLPIPGLTRTGTMYLGFTVASGGVTLTRLSNGDTKVLLPPQKCTGDDCEDPFKKRISTGTRRISWRELIIDQ